MSSTERFAERRATTSDIAAIVAVTNAAYWVEQPFIEGERTSAQQLAENFERGGFFVVEDRFAENTICASIYYELRGERSYFGLLAVAPDYQGHGLAKRLIQAVMEYCREQGCAFLDISVLSVRKELFAFYRHLGFAAYATQAFHTPALQRVTFKLIQMTKALREEHLL